MSLYKSSYRVSFGDCDPAGIVFYPNIFRWVDATFHAFLQDHFDGHQALCKRIKSQGLGLVHVESSFQSPLSQGADLTIAIVGIVWSDRTFKVKYIGESDAIPAFAVEDTRAVFVMKDGRFSAGSTNDLQEVFSKKFTL